MNCILKSVTITDPNSINNGKDRDILIENGKITSIGSKLKNPNNYREIKAKDLHVSPGWYDMCVNFSDPGFEYKEDIDSGLNAASKGGFTGVLVMPCTQPTISSKSEVNYVKTKGSNGIIDLDVLGTLSHKLQGRQIAEYGDMSDAGALGFTDYKKPLNNPEVMIRALDYARNFNSLICSFPHDDQISPGGLMNEGTSSVSLGLKGIPDISEEVRLKRDIEFLKYSGGRLHVLFVSTKKSVELIREAKKDKLEISCGIAAHQLSFLDKDLSDFDTRLKVLPPFRTEVDRKALIKGLKDGTIDVICSDHSPVDIDHKKIEFEYAEFGISGIETAFASIHSETNTAVELQTIIENISVKPRRILRLEIPVIEVGQQANLTLFQPKKETQFQSENMASRSKNTPFGGSNLLGEVVGTINNNKIHLNNS